MTLRIILALGIFLSVVSSAFADGIVSRVTSSPVFANGIVRDIRSGLNIHLQTDDALGLDFMNPEVIGYGVPPGGSLEVELTSGFQRDPEVPLDGSSILLTVGTPQQGLPEGRAGYKVREGENEHTFVIEPTGPDGMLPEALESPAPGVAFDQVQQRGIKIIHIGRNFAFVSRGETGTVEVRFKDSSGNVIARGQGAVDFLPEPTPRIYPTNVTHDQRNHNWQRLKPGQVVGVAKGTVPLPMLVFEKNEGFGKVGILGAGVLSSQQLAEMNFELPQSLARFNGGLILKDRNNDGVLNPATDVIIGGIVEEVPAGAVGHQVVTPLVRERPFLSKPTGEFSERAGKAFGGAIMQVVYIAGDKPGLYRPTFVLLERPGDLESPDGSSFTYTIVAEKP